MIRILYFARLREQLQTASEDFEFSPDLDCVGVLTGRLRRRGAIWDEALGGRQTILMAVNEEVASAGTPLKDGDEVAYFPPVTGG